MRSYQKEIIYPLIAASSLISIVIFSLFYALYQFDQIENSVTKIHAQQINLTKLNHAIIYAEDNQRGYMLTNSLTFLNHYHENKTTIITTVKLIKHSGAEFSGMVKHVLNSYQYAERLFKEIEKNIEIQNNAGAYAPHLTLIQSRGASYMHHIQQELKDADDYLTEKLQEKHAAIDRIVEISILLAFFLVMSFFAVLYFMYRRLARFFNEIISNTSKVTQLSYEATHDPLTNLYNRRGFENCLDSIHEAAYKAKSPYAVFYLDLDGFKAINDRYNHEMGDKLLIEVARMFQQFLRDDDCLARLGGDEFALIVQNVKYAAELDTLASRLIQALAKPIMVRGEALMVGVSIGVSIYRRDGFKPDVLLKAADSAMYEAKQSGKNRVCFYQKMVEKQSMAVSETDDIQHFVA